MIDESAAVLPLWMLIAATFGFMVGEAVGGQARVRNYLEQANDDLREQLQAASLPHQSCNKNSLNNGTSSTTSISESPL